MNRRLAGFVARTGARKVSFPASAVWLAPVIFVFRKARRHVRAGRKRRKRGAALPENLGDSGRRGGKITKIFL